VCNTTLFSAKLFSPLAQGLNKHFVVISSGNFHPLTKSWPTHWIGLIMRQRKYMRFVGLYSAIVLAQILATPNSWAQISHPSKISTTGEESIDSMFADFSGKRPGAAVMMAKDRNGSRSLAKRSVQN